MLGSANATNAAILRGINSEILVSFKGRKSRVGTLDKLLSVKGWAIIEWILMQTSNLKPMRN
ncbi:hypothetical protein ACOZB2_31035, partial [Pantoea endophytica]